MVAQRSLLADGRLHLNHGPIDLIIEAFGPAREIARAYDQAWARFPDILPTLTSELTFLRRPVQGARPRFSGPVARRMSEAVWPYRARFITPMAAVAGAVADEMLAAMIQGRALRKAYVNDGGDIALYLTSGEKFTAGIVGDLAAPAIDGRAEIAADSAVRGIATSGQAGRSFSLGIADAVTVLARTAAQADAAATMIANAVNVDDRAVARQPASSLDPDSDLGGLPVTVSVGPLDREAIESALDSGEGEARRFTRAGLILAAMLQLRGVKRIVTADGNPDSQVSFDHRGNLPRGRPAARTRASAGSTSGRDP
jgi:ApbE superfamily uncharacterized protein (UPF0280 family)